MKKLLLTALFLFINVVIFGQDPVKTTVNKVLSTQYWKEQAIRDILPNWTRFARDSIYGGFKTNLGESWEPTSDDRKYPGMIGRHLFSYSVAYLLTGVDKYLDIAEETRDYLVGKAWDQDYGGWYAVLDCEGTPADLSKNMFTQSYAATGLAMYYFVTHDSVARRYLEKTNGLIESRAWDQENQGYYNVMSRDWKATDPHKTLSSQLAPVSGYLLYYYLATRNNMYFEQARRIMEVVLSRMGDKQTGWVLENFDADWDYLPVSNDEINVGHNLEVAWVLLRMCLVNDVPAHLQYAEKLDANLIQYGFDPGSGMWFTTLLRPDPENHGTKTYWWVQAYGNMYRLVSYHHTGQQPCISGFIKGADFWDRFFLDQRFGDNYFSVDTSGKATETQKGNPYKTSYHSMEHCFLNYLYLHFWAIKQPLTLYFKIKSPSEGEKLFPVPVEDQNIKVRKANNIIDSNELEINIREQSILLPGIKNIRVEVVLEPRDSSEGSKKK